MGEVTTVDVVIVGGGIGGLTAAYELSRAGFSIILLESSDRLGGQIKSDFANEFLLESGPNSTLSTEALQTLIQELGLESQTRTPQSLSKKRYFAIEKKLSDDTCNRQLVDVPSSFIELLITPIISFRGKLRCLLEPFVSASSADDESVSDFITRRLGSEVSENVVATMLAGIWAADISKLSCRSALPSLWEMEKQNKSLIRGALENLFNKKKNGSPRAKIVSFLNGMETLINELTSKLPSGSVYLNSAVNSIQKKPLSMAVAVEKKLANGNYAPLEIRAKHVLVTTPAATTSKIVIQLPSGIASSIAKIKYSPIGILHLSYPIQNVRHNLDGFGFLVPPKFKLSLMGAIFNSSLFPQRAPKDKHLLTCFIGGAYNPSASDVTKREKMLAAIAELNSLIGATCEPEVLKQTYYQHAIPNFPVGHHQLQEQLNTFMAQHPQITIIGNWFYGTSVAARVEAARAAAVKISSIMANEAKAVVNS